MGRRQPLRGKNWRTNSLILQNCTPELEGNLKGMDTYDKIDTEKYVIDIVNLIHIILQLGL